MHKHGVLDVDEMLGLLKGRDLEAEMFGSGKHAPPLLLANGMPICPVAIAGTAEVRIIELEGAVREYGAKCNTAWAVQAFQSIAYERRQLTKKAIEREHAK